MPDLMNYLIQLIVGAGIIFALRKQKFNLPADPEKFWRHLVAG